MAWTECCHHDGSFLWMLVGHHRNTAMSRVGAGVVAVGLTSSSGSMIEEAPAALGATHRIPKECIKQATKKTCMEISGERGTILKR